MADTSPAARIDARIKELDDWRGRTLARLRALIRQADPDVVEEWKWGIPVWSHDGIICTGEVYKNTVKMTFAKGASVPDPSRLFNSSLEGNVRRAIDVREGEKLNEAALKKLIRAAVAVNVKSKPTARPAAKAKALAPKPKPKLLSGGNPQIAKGYGDAPVKAYIGAMPGWKRDVMRRFDALVVRTVPGVRKAVKWNSPFYGREGQGWFLSVHAFANYLKVAFFRGTSLKPLPPVSSKSPEVRYVHLGKDDLDEAQLAKWIRQAAALPGWDT